LSNAFVILDEAQNTTTEQMFMLLTRIGLNSKCVVTATSHRLICRKQALGRRRGVAGVEERAGIATVYFTERDVVRHELVRVIIARIRRTARPRPNLASNDCYVRFSKTRPSRETRLASRKRRRPVTHDLMRNLECSSYAKVFIFALFAGGLAFLVFSGQQPEPTKNYVIALLVLATAITQL